MQLPLSSCLFVSICRMSNAVPPPNSKCLHRLSAICILYLHDTHSSLSTTFFVVLAFLWKTGLVCPPYPDCFRSYLRFPWARNESFPFLYCVTLCCVCFLQSFPLQYVFLVFGMLTMFADVSDCCGCLIELLRVTLN